MIQKKRSNTTSTMFMLLMLIPIHTAISGPLEIDDGSNIPIKTQLKSLERKDSDEPLAFMNSTGGLSKMLGNVVPNSNIPIDASNDNEIIFGNVQPNSKPSISTINDINNQMSQTQQLTNAKSVSSLQPMIENISTNSDPSVSASNDNHVFYGNFLRNSHSMDTTINQGGQTLSLANLNPLTVMKNNLMNDNPNRNPSKAASDNSMIATSPVLLLGTQQALLIPIQSVPSIFQNMLSGLISMDNSQLSGIGRPQLPGIKL